MGRKRKSVRPPLGSFLESCVKHQHDPCGMAVLEVPLDPDRLEKDFDRYIAPRRAKEALAVAREALELAKAATLKRPKGRPKGSPNETPKAIDPTMLAALEDWKESGDSKPKFFQLAQRHSGLKNPIELKKWRARFTKFKQKALRTKS